MTALSPAIAERRSRDELLRWSVSAFVVLALYALAALALGTWRVLPLRLDEVPPAIMLDLAPLAKAPAPQAPSPPAPSPPVVQPREEVTPPPVPVPPPPRAEPRKPRLHRPPPPPQVAPEPPAPVPPVAEAPAPSAPLAQPGPAPQPAPAATPQTSPQMAASFQAALLAHLERFKRYPRAALMRRDQGTATLRFTMDRAGHVLAAALEHSSGHESLDDEVIAMVKRAEPLPAIPPEFSQTQLELVVPIRFVLR
jgi:protein TonB